MKKRIALFLFVLSGLVSGRMLFVADSFRSGFRTTIESIKAYHEKSNGDLFKKVEINQEQLYRYLDNECLSKTGSDSLISIISEQRYMADNLSLYDSDIRSELFAVENSVGNFYDYMYFLAISVLVVSIGGTGYCVYDLLRS